MAEAKPRVVITGAAGNVGTTLWQAWEAEEIYELTLSDVQPIDRTRSRTEIGDVFDLGFMRTICQNQDVLVHLAFFRGEDSAPDSDRMSDIGMTLALFGQPARPASAGSSLPAPTKSTPAARAEAAAPCTRPIASIPKAGTPP